MYDVQGRLVGEYDNAGKLIQETVWMNDLPVATIRPKGANASTPLGTSGTGAAGTNTAANNLGTNTQGNPVNVDFFYVHPDHLGTPRVVTKPADNKRMWEWQSQPFGETAANENPQNLTGAALTANQFRYNLRFPGQVFDAETSKHYNYFRDYDPSIGRFVESDPIGLRGGVNTFAYGAALPISKSDERGLMPSGSDPNCFASGQCKCRTPECAAGLPPAPRPKTCSVTCASECLAYKLGGGAIGSALWGRIPSAPFSNWSFVQDACILALNSPAGLGFSLLAASIVCEAKCCVAQPGIPQEHFKPW
jgi:RHS repeat-associated protein